MVEVLLRCHSGLTDNELAIVDLIRDLSGRADPNPHDPHLKARLQTVFAPTAPTSE